MHKELFSKITGELDAVNMKHEHEAFIFMALSPSDESINVVCSMQGKESQIAFLIHHIMGNQPQFEESVRCAFLIRMEETNPEFHSALSAAIEKMK